MPPTETQINALRPVSPNGAKAALEAHAEARTEDQKKLSAALVSQYRADLDALVREERGEVDRVASRLGISPRGAYRLLGAEGYGLLRGRNRDR